MAMEEEKYDTAMIFLNKILELDPRGVVKVPVVPGIGTIEVETAFLERARAALPELPKYPRLPVLSCPRFEQRAPSNDER